MAEIFLCSFEAEESFEEYLSGTRDNGVFRFVWLRWLKSNFARWRKKVS